MWLLLVLGGVLCFLWILDALITVHSVRKFGTKEENPLLRILLRHKHHDFILFKIIDLCAFLLISYFLWRGNPKISYILLIFFILVYAAVNWHNLLVLRRK